MKHTTKRLALLLAMVMAFSVLFSCGAYADAEKDPDAMLIYNIYSGPDNDLNPYLMPAYDFMRQVFCSPLVMSWVDQETGENHYDYIMAESIDANDDETEFTIHIRPGMKWHDGEPYTAHDVVYSVTEIWTDDEILYSQWYGRCPVEGEWTEVDDLTVNVRFTESFPGFLEYLYGDLVVCPAHIFEGIHGTDFNEFAFDGAPVGNGPFKYVEHVTGEYWLLERFEDYFEPSQVKYLRLQFITQDEIAVMAMQAGELDVTRTWDAITGTLIADPNVNVIRVTDRTTYCLWLSTRAESTYADVNVRKALACLIDKTSLCDNLLGGMAIAKDNFIDPLTPGYDPAYDTPYKYDPAQAKAFLEEAGYTLGDDGLYQKDGATLVINYDDSHGAGSEQERIGLYLQDEAKKIGLKITINEWDDDNWSRKAREEFSLDCYISKCYFYADGSVINTVYSAINEIGYYYENERYHNMIFADPALDESFKPVLDGLQAAYDSRDEDACTEALHALWTWQHENENLIPVYDSCTAFSARVNVHIEDCEYHGSDMCYINRIWVEK